MHFSDFKGEDRTWRHPAVLRLLSSVSTPLGASGTEARRLRLCFCRLVSVLQCLVRWSYVSMSGFWSAVGNFSMASSSVRRSLLTLANWHVNFAVLTIGLHLWHVRSIGNQCGNPVTTGSQCRLQQPVTGTLARSHLVLWVSSGSSVRHVGNICQLSSVSPLLGSVISALRIYLRASEGLINVKIVVMQNMDLDLVLVSVDLRVLVYAIHSFSALSDGVSPKGSSFTLVVRDELHSLGVLPSSATPSRVGDVVSVDLNEVAYSKRLSLCKYSLIDWVVLAKGDKPWILNVLKEKLSKIWNLSSGKLISMGKIYFQVLCIRKRCKAKFGL